jgi:ElaB/YqjD/DUF883 family membrane-anchored ribosome-binding protein
VADTKNQVKGGIDNAADKAKNLTERASDAAQGAREQGEHLLHRAGEVAGQARDKAQEWAGDARDAVSLAGEKAQRWAGDAYDATADTVGDFGREVTVLIRKHPIPALLIGFGVGLLLGRTARMI